MATSLDALEALLQFREGASVRSQSRTHSHSIRMHPAMPVPNPLDPSQPHIIEGDAPAPVAAFGSGAKSAFSPKPTYAPVTVNVPNPLAASRQQPQPLPPPVSCLEAMTPSSSQDRPVSHGFAISPDSSAEVPTSYAYGAKPSQALEVEVRTDKIRDALNSKPQRGKKRQNLNDLERLELTRTRNREHAKSTRMKKKQRLQELMDIEKKYLLLKEKETLDLCRRQSLNEFVETSGNRAGQQSNCPHSSSLVELASADVNKPQFAATEEVAVSGNSGMVKVSVHGTDLESGAPKALLGVVCVDFTPGTASISTASLYWSSPKSAPAPGSMFPSVSVLSFES